MAELIFNPPKIAKCKHCNRDKCDHQAKTLNCPMSRHKFTPFHPTQVYEPKENK